MDILKEYTKNFLEDAVNEKKIADIDDKTLSKIRSAYYGILDDLRMLLEILQDISQLKKEYDIFNKAFKIIGKSSLGRIL